MSCECNVPHGRLVNNVISRYDKLPQSKNASASTEQSGENEPKYGGDILAHGGDIQDMVHEWVLEDLDTTASVCEMSVEDVFEDVLALLCSDVAQLHSTDPGYADAIKQLMEWWLEDIQCVARSFDLDPGAVFADALEVIISDTHLCDRIQGIEAVLTKGFAGN